MEARARSGLSRSVTRRFRQKQKDAAGLRVTSGEQEQGIVFYNVSSKSTKKLEHEVLLKKRSRECLMNICKEFGLCSKCTQCTCVNGTLGTSEREKHWRCRQVLN